MKLNRRTLLLSVGAAALAAGIALTVIGLTGIAPGSGDQATPPFGQTASSAVIPVSGWELRAELPVPTAAPTPTVVADTSEPPTRLAIEAIGVDAPVINLGLDPELIPEVPSTGAEVGWYDFSAKPGTGSNVVLAGHVTWDKRPAVFWSLGEIKEGDLIHLTTGRGDQMVYEVTANLLVDPSDPESLQLIYPTDTEMLTLVTCGGTFNRDAGARFGGEYTHRAIVQATPVS